MVTIETSQVIISKDFLNRFLSSLVIVPLLLCSTDSGVQCVINVCVCVCMSDVTGRPWEASAGGGPERSR